MRNPQISLKNWHRKKKRSIVSASILQEHNELKCRHNYVTICARASGRNHPGKGFYINFVINVEDFIFTGPNDI